MNICSSGRSEEKGVQRSERGWRRVSSWPRGGCLCIISPLHIWHILSIAYARSLSREIILNGIGVWTCLCT